MLRYSEQQIYKLVLPFPELKILLNSKPMLLLALVIISLALSLNVEGSKVWTFVIEESGGDGETEWIASDPAHEIVDDSVAELDLNPGETGEVAVWMVAHVAAFTNPTLYLLQVNPSADFPTIVAEMSSEGIGPETLDFTETGKPLTNEPWSGPGDPDPTYDIFPSSYSTAAVIDDSDGKWELDPEDGSYFESDLTDEATKTGNDDAYKIVDLDITGSVLGTYILHMDTRATNSGGSPEWNPFSHGASVIINIVPVMPIAAGLLTFGTAAGMIFLRRRNP
jgi:hypothetical protein